jgi:hypothetical protein
VSIPENDGRWEKEDEQPALRVYSAPQSPIVASACTQKWSLLDSVIKRCDDILRSLLHHLRYCTSMVRLKNVKLDYRCTAVLDAFFNIVITRSFVNILGVFMCMFMQLSSACAGSVCEFERS